jgi:DNA-directed RNA polymerase specialized sigma24 family protein
VLDAEDALQESMVRACDVMNRFNKQSSIKTWLYRIATNVFLDTPSSADRRRMRPLASTPRPVGAHDRIIAYRRVDVPCCMTGAVHAHIMLHTVATDRVAQVMTVPPEPRSSQLSGDKS